MSLHYPGRRGRRLEARHKGRLLWLRCYWCSFSRRRRLSRGVEDVEGFVDGGALYAGGRDAGGPGVVAGGESGGVRVGWECEGGCNEEGGGEEGAKREHG